MNSLHGTELVAARIEAKVHAHLPAFRKIGDPLGTVFTDVEKLSKDNLVEFAGVPSESAAPPFEHVSVIHCGLWTIQCSETDIEQIAVGDDIIADQQDTRKIKLPGAKDLVTTYQLRKFNGNDIGPKPLSQNNAQSYRFTRHLIGRVYARDFKSKTIECLLKTQCYHRQYDEYIADKRQLAETYYQKYQKEIQTATDRNVEVLQTDADFMFYQGKTGNIQTFLKGLGIFLGTSFSSPLEPVLKQFTNNYFASSSSLANQYNSGRTQQVQEIAKVNTGAAAAPRRSRKRAKATMSVRDATEAAAPAKKKK